MKNILFVCNKHNKRFTSASSLANLEAPGQFSWMPSCYWEKITSIVLDYVKMHENMKMATRNMILKNEDRPTKAIVSRVLLILEH